MRSSGSLFGIVCTESEPLRGVCLLVFKWGGYKTRLDWLRLKIITITNHLENHRGSLGRNAATPENWVMHWMPS